MLRRAKTEMDKCREQKFYSLSEKGGGEVKKDTRSPIIVM